MTRLRRVVRAATPPPLVRLYHRFSIRKVAAPFTNVSNEEIFSKIYQGPYWGNGPGVDLTSGDGTSAPEIVAPYIEAVTAFLESLPSIPDAVDLGCGDFTVGAQLRPFCDQYTACDVVPDVISRNKVRYADAAVDFRVVDIVSDPLPDGDVVFLRQVLQHLSNADVAQVAAALGKFKHAIVTEHIPIGRFTPNLDMPSGPHIRVGLGSGIDLVEPPFNMAFAARQVLCDVAQPYALIRTTHYALG